MNEKLTYKVFKNNKRNIKEVTVFSENKVFFEIECFINSPYTIEEEIQNYLNDNGYEDNEYNFVNMSLGPSLTISN